MRYSTLYDIREIKIITRIICHYTFIRLTEIWNTDYNKCYWGYRATKMTTCCWWECNMAQPLWKTNVAVSYKVKCILAIWSGNQSCSLEFTQKSWKVMSTWNLTKMFTAMLSIIAKSWKHPWYLSEDEWINKMWYI